jgi:hypothetical protein
MLDVFHGTACQVLLSISIKNFVCMMIHQPRCHISHSTMLDLFLDYKL